MRAPCLEHAYLELRKRFQTNDGSARVVGLEASVLVTADSHDPSLLLDIKYDILGPQAEAFGDAKAEPVEQHEHRGLHAADTFRHALVTPQQFERL